MLYFITNKKAALKLLDSLSDSLKIRHNNTVRLDKTRTVCRRIVQIRNTVEESTYESARYIKCTEDEVERELSEVMTPLLSDNNIMILAFIGREVNYRCKDIIERVTKESVKTIVFPTNNNDNAIRLCVLFTKKGYFNIGEVIDDSAIKLLRYYD